MLLAALAGLLGVIMSVYDYLTPGTGIDGEQGTILVIISSVLILLAALYEALGSSIAKWLRATLTMLLLLGIVGTGLAAYFLEAQILLVLMAVALVGWLLYAFSSGSRPAIDTGARPIGGMQ
jgi:hypothetical protein